MSCLTFFDFDFALSLSLRSCAQAQFFKTLRSRSRSKRFERRSLFSRLKNLETFQSTFKYNDFLLADGFYLQYFSNFSKNYVWYLRMISLAKDGQIWLHFERKKWALICARHFLGELPLIDLENGRAPARARQSWARAPSAAHLSGAH